MGIGRTNLVTQQIATIFQDGNVARLTDGQLVDRFARDRDAAAFEAIIARHGPMVYSVCMSLLADPHHADDAFQATFLVLARKAADVRDPELLGQWLYGVAHRTARKARNLATRRRTGELIEAELEGVRPGNEDETRMLQREEAAVLHEEISRLPERYRSAVVLCYLQGQTHAEAAQRLRRPVGTISARLSRAREMLRGRLIRRGLAPGAMLAALLAHDVASAAVPRALIDKSIRAGTGITSASVAVLAEGVLRAMFVARWSSITVVLVSILGVLAATYVGTFAATAPTAANADDTLKPAKPEPAPVQKPVSKPAAAAKQETTLLSLDGQATDLEGKPVVGAKIMLVSTNGIDAPLGETTTGADGRYAFRDAQLPVRRYRDDSDLCGTFQVYGTAAGYGIAWHGMRQYVPIPRPDDRPVQGLETLWYADDDKTVNLTFRPAVALRGRIVDEKGKPIKGAQIQLYSGDYTVIAGHELHKNFREFWSMFMLPPNQTTAHTVADGRFAFEGLGEDTFYYASITHPDYAGRGMYVATCAESLRMSIYQNQSEVEIAGNDLDVRLETCRTVTIGVVYADTNKPAGHVSVSASDENASGIHGYGKTDTDGNVTLRLPPGEYRVTIDPPKGSDCVRTNANLTVKQQADPQRAELTVDRGCILILKAVDAVTGNGIRGVSFLQGDEDGDPGGGREVQSSTYFIDNPTTDAEGQLRAVVNPGQRSFAVSRTLKDAGYLIDGMRQTMELPAGKTVTVTFALRKVSE